MITVLSNRTAAWLCTAGALILGTLCVDAAEVLRIYGNEVPGWVEGELGEFSTPDAELGATDEYYAALYLSAEEAIKVALKVHLTGTGEEALVLSSTHFDRFDSAHVAYTQTFSDLPVVGAGFRVELALREGVIRRIHGRFYPAKPEYELEGQELLSPEEALVRALQEGELEGEALGDSELVFLGGGDELHLAYRTRVALTSEPSPHDIFAGALDGRFLSAEPNWVAAYPPQPGPTPPPTNYVQIFRALTAATWDSNANDYLELCQSTVVFPFPGFMTLSIAPCTPDASTARAQNHAYQAYRYFREEHGQHSYDDAYSPLVTIANLPLGPSGYSNAYWDNIKKRMLFGVADGIVLKDLTLGFDVTAHELTHGVSQHLANFSKTNEPGALNESMSDIFAAAASAWKDGEITANTWLVGEEVAGPMLPGALRFMSNPTYDGVSVDYYPELYTGSADAGGVHWNCGISNLAFYLLVEGGNHPLNKTNVTVTGIGMDKAIAIFYEALSQMNPSSDFLEARLLTISSATSLYDIPTAAKVAQAWSAVGVI